MASASKSPADEHSQYVPQRMIAPLTATQEVRTVIPENLSYTEPRYLYPVSNGGVYGKYRGQDGLGLQLPEGVPDPSERKWANVTLHDVELGSGRSRQTRSIGKIHRGSSEENSSDQQNDPELIAQIEFFESGQVPATCYIFATEATIQMGLPSQQ